MHLYLSQYFSTQIMININKISPHESAYLQTICDIAQPPKNLYFIGELPKERRPTVAIIGSRKLTAYGKEVGHRLAYDLASQGIVIISGLAIGIDAIAHQAALEASGTTIAILGNGLPQVYPASNRQLGERIVGSGGAIISEYEPGKPAMAHQFLERNRLVSGLSDVVVVVEAASRSGTLSTANHALEQGKDVAAVPGNITSPMSAGCNNLIKHGAAPITDAKDVLQLLGIDETQTQAALPLAHTKEEAQIIRLIASGVRDGHDLQIQSSLDTSSFNQTISMLEISGKIRPLGGNKWTIR